MQRVIEEITKQKTAEVEPEVENPREIPEASPTLNVDAQQLLGA